MKVVFFVLLGIFLGLFLLLFGVKFKVLVLLHAKNKSAYYTLNHRLFSLFQGKVILLEDGKVSIIISKNKIFPKSTKEGFGSILGKEIMKQISVRRLDVYVDTGKVGDAMTTAIVAGGVKSVSGIISAIMKNKQIETHFHISQDRDDEVVTVALDLNVKINLIQFLIAYIKANKKYNLNQQKEKKYA